MIARGYFILTVLIINHVLSLPVTPTFHEKDDVEVMKCIVEVLVEALSRPHPMPVSQECLDRLRNDERLVSILRHHNFLRELQDIAVQGVHERAPQHRDLTADHVTSQPEDLQSVDAAADQSMLAALGGPGERSILSQMRRTGGAEEVKGETEMSKRVETSHEGKEIVGKEEDRKGEKDETPDNRNYDASKEEEEDEDKEEVIKKKEAEEDKEEDEDKKGAEERNTKEVESTEEQYGPEDKSEEKNSAEGEVSEVNREVAESNRWSRAKEAPHSTKSAEEEEKVQEVRSLQAKVRKEVPHHSKEVVEEEAEKEEKKRKKEEAQRSLEVKRLQMMVRRNPEEKREGGEEEGSASRKVEEPEIESLAAIESELESVAQKLHELRRG